MAKSTPNVGIVGYGFVGKAMHKLFPESELYDPTFNFPRFGFTQHQLESSAKAKVNKCDVAFVCVPTNMNSDSGCDTSIVEEAVDWLKTPLVVIRSTIVPGTTQRLIAKHTDKIIVFQPEYIGETIAHPLLDEKDRKFVILGGYFPDCEKVVELYQSVYNSSVHFCFLDPTEAEIVKYMENTAIASMVTLCNEFYNICDTYKASYNKVREAFLLDPRMSRYFTFVYPNERGFGGKCLPKDLNAIVKASQEKGYDPEFIKAILYNNDRIKNTCQETKKVGSYYPLKKRKQQD